MFTSVSSAFLKNIKKKIPKLWPTVLVSPNREVTGRAQCHPIYLFNPLVFSVQSHFPTVYKYVREASNQATRFNFIMSLRMFKQSWNSEAVPVLRRLPFIFHFCGSLYFKNGTKIKKLKTCMDSWKQGTLQMVQKPENLSSETGYLILN